MKRERIVLKVAVIRPGKKTREFTLKKKHLINAGVVACGIAVGGVAGKLVADYYVAQEAVLATSIFM